MAEIQVSIAGRMYRMACDDGQEEHLRALAARLDLKMAEMRVRFGEIGDQRITVMAALALTDEAADAEMRAAALTKEVGALHTRAAEAEALAGRERAEATGAIDGLAQRVERLTQSIQQRLSRPL